MAWRQRPGSGRCTTRSECGTNLGRLCRQRRLWHQAANRLVATPIAPHFCGAWGREQVRCLALLLDLQIALLSALIRSRRPYSCGGGRRRSGRVVVVVASIGVNASNSIGACNLHSSVRGRKQCFRLGWARLAASLQLKYRERGRLFRMRSPLPWACGQVAGRLQGIAQRRQWRVANACRLRRRPDNSRRRVFVPLPGGCAWQRWFRSAFGCFCRNPVA